MAKEKEILKKTMMLLVVFDLTRFTVCEFFQKHYFKLVLYEALLSC